MMMTFPCLIVVIGSTDLNTVGLWSSAVSSARFVQVDLRGLGALYQDLRQPGLSDPDRSLRAVPPRRHQPLRPQQVLQRREAREPEALQQSPVSGPVEAWSLV